LAHECEAVVVGEISRFSAACADRITNKPKEVNVTEVFRLNRLPTSGERPDACDAENDQEFEVCDALLVEAFEKPRATGTWTTSYSYGPSSLNLLPMSC
jgi:hypothetical protein